MESINAKGKVKGWTSSSAQCRVAVLAVIIAWEYLNAYYWVLSRACRTNLASTWLITKPHQLFLHLMQFLYDPLSSFIYSWRKWKKKVKISGCYGELETMIRIHERESIQHQAYMDDLNLPYVQMRTEMVINTNHANHNHLDRFPSLTIHCFLIDLSASLDPSWMIKGCFKAQWPHSSGS